MDQTLINRIVEAALLASSQPLTAAQLGALFTLDEPAPDGSIQAALQALQADCEGRGVELVEVASGWRYQVRADVHAWVARLWTERQARYTRATLETLALIAYRQPITRGEIEQVRGVATSSNIIKALEEREWIRVVGHRDVPGRPELLGTTKAFLDYFGLKRLDELPPLSELKDFGELEPQLEFEGERAVGGIAGADGSRAADLEAGDPAANDEAAPDAGGRTDDAPHDATGTAEDAEDAGDAATDHASNDVTAADDDRFDDDMHTDALDHGTVDDPGHDPDAEALEADADAYKGSDVDAEIGIDAGVDANADLGIDVDPEPEAGDDADTEPNDRSDPDRPLADGDDAAAAQQDALADDGDSTRSRHE